MSIFCIGQACYDITGSISTQEIVTDSKYRFEEYTACCGGPALNAACVAGKWGASSYLVARLGHDMYAEEIRKSLKVFNVNEQYMIKDPLATTPFSFIVSHGLTGCRTIFNFPTKQSDAKITMPYFAEDAVSTQKSNDIVPTTLLMDGHDIAAAKKYKKAYGTIPFICDAGTLRAETLESAQLSTYLISSQHFASQYLGYDFSLSSACLYESMRKLQQINSSAFVAVTLGANGLLTLIKDTLFHISVPKVEVVDTTGAGDIFHGAFTYAIELRYEVENALRLATAAAALSVGKIGSQVSIPDLLAAQKLMADIFLKRID